MEQLKKLLQDVNLILQKEKVRKEESRKRGERFNVFEMLGVAHYEVTHSKIIAGFLNPQGSHGQGNLFLRLFLQTIENNDKIDIDTSNTKVYTEYGTRVDGRLDIFIENGSHGIIIENKVYARDQDEQLSRYGKFASDHSDQYIIYYLTLDGHEASEGSVIDPKTGERVNYNCISYSKDIINWLQLCIHECATMPLVRETLVQYLNHIKQLSNQDMDSMNKEELLKIMTAYPECVAAIYYEQESYKQYVYNTFVKPMFIKFGESNNLIFNDCMLFSSERAERGFYFHKEEWKCSAIWIYTESFNEKNFFWGISDYSGRELAVSQIKLDCINKCIRGVTNEQWPYGREYLDKYRDWDLNTIAEMINGHYVDYIIKLVLTAVEEIDKKGLPMP